MRLFIAAILPVEIQEYLSGYINSLSKELDGVKWERPEKLHITLKFLGSVDGSLVQPIASIIDRISQKYSTFDLNLTEFGTYPALRNPRVLYAGTSHNDMLSEFQEQLDSALSEIGFEPEARKFIPHVTIGRVKNRIRIKTAPELEKKSFTVSQIGLIKSELKPEGSVYTAVEIFELEK